VKTVIGHIADQAQMRGWLCGQFFPKDSPFCVKDIEVYVKDFPQGTDFDQPHYHPHGYELVIILSGRMRVRLNNEVFEVKSGDYFIIPGRTNEHFEEAYEPVRAIGIRTPSLPDNKIML